MKWLDNMRFSVTSLVGNSQFFGQSQPMTDCYFDHCDDITDFEICGFPKSINLDILRTNNYLSRYLENK